MSSQQYDVHWAVIPLQLVEGVLTQTLMNGQQYPSMHWSSERHISQFPTLFFGVQSATIRKYHLYIKIFTISNICVDLNHFFHFRFLFDIYLPWPLPWSLQEPSGKHIKPSPQEPRLFPSPGFPFTVHDSERDPIQQI